MGQVVDSCPCCLFTAWSPITSSSVMMTLKLSSGHPFAPARCKDSATTASPAVWTSWSPALGARPSGSWSGNRCGLRFLRARPGANGCCGLFRGADSGVWWPDPNQAAGEMSLAPGGGRTTLLAGGGGVDRSNLGRWYPPAIGVCVSQGPLATGKPRCSFRPAVSIEGGRSDPDRTATPGIGSQAVFGHLAPRWGAAACGGCVACGWPPGADRRA